MSITRVDPPIEVNTPKGLGFCYAWIDYTQDHNTLWKVCITESREWWDFPQSQIRGIKNISLGRVGVETPFDRKPNAPNEIAAKHDPYLEGILDRYNGKTPASFEDEYMAGYKAGKIGQK
jgi:hypothetical protein